MNVMADGKDPGALRTIGEVAAALGVRQHVLRYWEQQFPMLRPLKRSGGRRYYRPEDVELLARIATLITRDGYTLKGARQAIERAGENETETAVPDPPVRPAEAAPVDRGTSGDETTAPDPDDEPASLLPALRRIRTRLAAALEA